MNELYRLETERVLFWLIHNSFQIHWFIHTSFLWFQHNSTKNYMIYNSSSIKWTGLTIIRLFEDAHFLSLIFETSKKFEAKLRVRLVLGTLPETLTRNHHLSFIFHQFLILFCSAVTKCATWSYCVTIIVLGKNKHVKICLSMSAKLCAFNHLPT